VEWPDDVFRTWTLDPADIQRGPAILFAVVDQPGIVSSPDEARVGADGAKVSGTVRLISEVLAL